MAEPTSSHVHTACGRWRPASSVPPRRTMGANALAVLELWAAATWAAAPLAAQGVTEVFVDLNFDPQIGSPDADPAESVRRAHEVLDALAPA